MRLRLDASKLITAALLLVMTAALTRSIEAARWTSGLDVLFGIGVLGVLAGVLTSSSRIGTLRAHLLGLVLGLAFVAWRTAQLLPLEVVGEGSRLGALWGRMREWARVLISGATNTDELFFVFTMGAIVWFIAYNNAWFVLRYHWVWWAVLPTGLVMLVNLGYATPGNYSATPFIIFLLASMLLMVQVHLSRSRQRWEQEGLGREANLATKALLLGTALSVVLMSIAWRGPSRSLAVTARTAFQRAAQPFERVQDRWESAFGFLYPSGPAPGRIGGGFTSFTDSFKLGGPLRLGNRQVFTATGDFGQYWMTVANDVYQGDQWGLTVPTRDAGAADLIRGTRLPARAAQQELPEGLSRVEQDVRLDMPFERALFAADTPVQVSVPAVWQLSRLETSGTVPVVGELPAALRDTPVARLERVRFLLAQIGPGRVLRASPFGVEARGDLARWLEGAQPTPESTPGGAAPAAEATAEARVAAELQEARRRLEQLELNFAALESEGIEARYGYRAGEAPTIRYSYLEPNQQDALNLVSAQRLARGSAYKVTSIVANPTNSQLNAIKAPLPDWVSTSYLTVPETVPDRVGELAREITQGARTSHQKAQLIERYLRSMEYRENMPRPTPGRDFVDEFLFDQRAGYCTYFSSAMAIMLREVGVPTRVVRGFAPGRYDDRQGRIVVTEAQAHMWPQVWYTGYGWVNYEPTPIRSEVNRTEAAAAADASDPARDYNRYWNEQLRDRLDGQLTGDGEVVTGRVLPAPIRFALATAFALVVLAILLYLLTLLKLRGLRGARRQYAKLEQLGAALRLAPAAAQTPQEYGGRLSNALPQVRTSIGAIASRYVGEVFGRQEPRGRELDGEWRQVATSAARSAPGLLFQRARTFRPRRVGGRLRRR